MSLFVSRSTTSQNAFYKVIGLLRLLNLAYHHAHINAKGESYYGDHLLLQRLYEEGSSIEEIDSVMERMKGLFPEVPVSLSTVLKEVEHYARQFKAYDASTGTNPWPILIAIEMELQHQLDKAYKSVGEVKELAILDSGVANLLQGVADNHQKNLYLLQERNMKELTP